MSQAQQQQSAPPPLPDIAHPTEIAHSAEVDEKVDDRTQFYKELHHGIDDSPEQSESPPPLPNPPLSELPPRMLTVRGAYRATGSNVYQLDSARPSSVWRQHAPSLHVAMEPRRSRPRNMRHPKQAIVKKRYRAGQFIAGLFALMGWLLVVTGLAALWICIFEPALSVRLGSPNLLGSAGTMIGGLLTVALAVAARALFDLANGQREMVAIHQQRARFGAELY